MAFESVQASQKLGGSAVTRSQTELLEPKILIWKRQNNCRFESHVGDLEEDKSTIRLGSRLLRLAEGAPGLIHGGPVRHKTQLFLMCRELRSSIPSTANSSCMQLVHRSRSALEWVTKL